MTMTPNTSKLPSAILIANRGEIAIRIARTCRDLGIRSVAVYSEADAASLHLEACDQALCLTGLAPGQAYLDGARIIAAARDAGATAIHPGYGFLSENAGFARACTDAGLTFIGPDADIIARMGDKIAAKDVAAAAGVPIVPGVSDPPAEGAQRARDGDRDRKLIAAASKLAFPLLVKASAGGGGRGMRIVHDMADLPDAIVLARREALSAFGSDRLLIERYITNPRHVEVQIFGDRHGNVLHLLERDCSVQRRHQKLIEEAPAPGLRDTTRQALHEAALALARATRYDNAGTVEFVLDAETQEFFFLEVNTRLQVEHPVTEAILGVDLIEWQIRVAAGQPLPRAQADIVPHGWAIEARITAEDSRDGFRPQTGTLTRFAPSLGPGIRLDTGVREGSMVTPYYDSMLAKVIAHGPERATALTRLRQSLGGMTALGFPTNIAFLDDALSSEAFEGGQHTTHLVEQLVAAREARPANALETRLIHAAAAAAIMAPPSTRTSPSPWTSLGAWRAGGREACPPRRAVAFQDDAGTIHRYWVACNDAELVLEPIAPTDVEPLRCVANRTADRLELSHATQRYVFAVHVSADASRPATIDIDGPFGAHRLRKLDGLAAWRRAADKAAGGDRLIRAAGPGLVVSVAVAAGDNVAAGAPLLTTESMKMLTTIAAPVSGTIARVACAPGQAIAKGDLLVELEASAQEDV